MLACSQDATTRGFVNAELLAACKPGVIIINLARGALRMPVMPYLGLRHEYSHSRGDAAALDRQVCHLFRRVAAGMSGTVRCLCLDEEVLLMKRGW